MAKPRLGSVNFQINKIFKESGIFQPGKSKHNEKEAARSEFKRVGVSATSQNIAKKTDLHAYKTAESYKETWHKLGHHARELGLRDMTKIEPRHVQSFLEKRVADGIAYSTWKKEAAHVGKFGVALEKFNGSKCDLQPVANGVRDLARDTLKTSDVIRGFVEPKAVIDEMKNPDYQLLARVQLEGGARAGEVTLIRADQLRDGKIHLTNTKGGKERDILVEPDTYKQLQERLSDCNELRVSHDGYRHAVRNAAYESGERCTGTHDFRYCYAQQRYMELTKEGNMPEVAHQIISWEMGHERADITMHYLR